MQAHKLIDALKLNPPKGAQEQIGLLIEIIRIAQKIQFDLGDDFHLSNESFLDESKRIRLPYELCYFDFPGQGVLIALQLNKFPDRIRFLPIITEPNEQVGLHSFALDFEFIPEKGEMRYVGEDTRVARLMEAGKLNKTFLVTLAWLVRGLSVLNCSNVELSDCKPQQKLNKQRERKGREPVYTYQILEIKRRKSAGGRDLTSDFARSGPRLHLRRGHIRRLNEHQSVWVSSCVVGDEKKGIAYKEYKVKAG